MRYTGRNSPMTTQLEEMMKLEILMACMHQTDGSLIARSGITGDAVVINQSDHDGYAEYATDHGCAKMYITTQRGLTRSRNMAIDHSVADICMLCDDDEVFEADYEEKILGAYAQYPQADVIAFKIINWRSSFEDKYRQIRFPDTMKISSVQISFRRESLIRTGVRFDELLGSGSGNGAEEELKFLLDCQKKGLKIYYVPVEVARLVDSGSEWFCGFDQRFFYQRGATTRYILGLPTALAYALYYAVKKKSLYSKKITMGGALAAMLQGMWDNPVTRQFRRLQKTVTAAGKENQ